MIKRLPVKYGESHILKMNPRIKTSSLKNAVISEKKTSEKKNTVRYMTSINETHSAGGI